MKNVGKARMHYKEAKSILSTNNNMNIYRGHCGCGLRQRSKCHMEHDFGCGVKINARSSGKRSGKL